MLLVPAPLSVVVTGSISNPIRPIGTNITLTCTVELSPAVDVPVTVNTEWRGPAGFNKTNMAWPDTDNTSSSSMVTIFSFENINSGDYTCTAEVVAMQMLLSLYLNDSKVRSNETRITTGKLNTICTNTTPLIKVFMHPGVYLFLKGEELSNNTFLTTNDEANSGNSGVTFPVCYTDKLNCCSMSNEGVWSWPDNTTPEVAVKFMVTQNDCGAVNLTYDNNIPPPQGIYCCTVPNADNMNQTVCVNTG